MGSSGPFDIVAFFQQKLAADADVAVPVAAIEALVEYIDRSKAATMSELTFFAVTTEHIQDLEHGKLLLLERGRRFVEKATSCREGIAKLGTRFIQDEHTLFVHSYSRVVLQLLRNAVAEGLRFSVLVTESQPTGSGLVTARALQKLGVPCRLVPDAAVASVMEAVDMVLIGAEAVTENGGIIGTYQMALGARAAGKPCYAVAESYKFVRRLPLNQRDLPGNAPSALRLASSSVQPYHTAASPAAGGEDEIEWLQPCVDFTPASYIDLFITDLGVLTPADVGDEVFRLYA
ncbi:eukaryotic translation initiation factor 2B, subunit 1 alpha, 26kDa-like protein [Thamnocephalis sphaerospora]|uniref:Translation initiation factor eIF2B subunit alpha n=1 Tax=Thamnocephalis sphaerospora TaxID=78915 RepID=A0A4P9XIR2_9FUNG|nr:eukaryotic translation initiation factor 2B, subunit 1 alpha, 26kDa-like protein [Thamnocephalis sphaerospora]|eukprot:RKP05596.1 eukaryotic translation initiation factor 2B, subunit 1 alpha, 26kDa-like protein [Thamnocephalis sphaerospora]